MNDELTSNYARTRAKREAINEAEFRLGYFFATLENNIIAFRDQTGGTYSVPSIAYRLGRLLTAKALREEPGLAELLPEMQQGNSPALLGTGDQLGGHVEPEQAEVHVHARVGRPLGSRNGFKWPNKPFKEWTQEEKRAKWRHDAQNWRHRKQVKPQSKGPGRGQLTPEQRKRGGEGIRGYWLKMTPEQRTAEMMRRRKKSIKLRGFRKEGGGPRTFSAERRAQMSEVMKAAYARKRAAQQAGEASS